MLLIEYLFLLLKECLSFTHHRSLILQVNEIRVEINHFIIQLIFIFLVPFDFIFNHYLYGVAFLLVLAGIRLDLLYPIKQEVQLDLGAKILFGLFLHSLFQLLLDQELKTVLLLLLKQISIVLLEGDMIQYSQTFVFEVQLTMLNTQSNGQIFTFKELWLIDELQYSFANVNVLHQYKQKQMELDQLHENLQTLKNQKHMIEKIMNEFHRPDPPRQVPKKEVPQVDVEMLQEELKIYRTLKERYDLVIQNIQQRNQQQIDQVNEKLLSNRQIVADYEEVINSLHAEIAKLKNELKESYLINTQLQEQISGLEGNISKKDNYILALQNLLQTKQTEDVVDKNVLMRQFKKVEILKSHNKRLQKQAKFFTKQVLSDETSIEVKFWKSKVDELSQSLEQYQFKNHTLEQRVINLSEKLRVAKKSANKKSQEEPPLIFKELLLENKQLREDKEAMKAKLIETEQEHENRISAIEQMLLKKHLELNPELDLQAVINQY